MTGQEPLKPWTELNRSKYFLYIFNTSNFFFSYSSFNFSFLISFYFRYEIVTLPDGKVLWRYFSCFCYHCLSLNFSECLNKSIVGEMVHVRTMWKNDNNKCISNYIVFSCPFPQNRFFFQKVHFWRGFYFFFSFKPLTPKQLFSSKSQFLEGVLLFDFLLSFPQTNFFHKKFILGGGEFIIGKKIKRI